MASTPVGKSATQFVAGAMRLIGAIDPGEGPTQQELADGFEDLNDMMDGFNADGYMIFTTRFDDFPLTASQQTYTLGAGGDFDIARPPELEYVGIIILANPAQPLEYTIPVYTTQDWAEKVPIKNVPGNIPLLVYDDGDFPLQNLTFWPVASDNLKVRFYTPQLLTQFSDLITQYTFPPAYAEMIKYQLAIRLAPQYEKQVSAEVASIAQSSLGTVKGSNPDDTQLRSDLRSNFTGSKMRAEWFNIP